MVNTAEIFRIIDIDKRDKPFLYKLQDLSGETIKGMFYGEELTPVELKKNHSIKILKKKVVNGKKYFNV